MGMGGRRQVLAVLLPWKRPGTNHIGGWVGPRAGIDECEKILPQPGVDPRIAQPVTSRYTDCAVPTHFALLRQKKNT